MSYPSIWRLKPPAHASHRAAPSCIRPGRDRMVRRAGSHDAGSAADPHARPKGVRVRSKRPAGISSGTPGAATVKEVKPVGSPKPAQSKSPRTATQHVEPPTVPRRKAARDHTPDTRRSPDSPRPRATSPTGPPTPRPSPTVLQRPLPARLADLEPATLLAALRARRYPAPAPAPVPAPSPQSPAQEQPGTKHADGPQRQVEYVSDALIVEVCEELCKRFLLQPNYSPSQLVDLIELVSKRCCGLKGAAEAAGSLLVRGCRPALSAAARSAAQDALARQLPRLVPALVALEYSNKRYWEEIFRIMQSNVNQYSGEEVAALVQALVELDNVMAAAAAAAAEGGAGASGSGSGSSSSSSGGGADNGGGPSTGFGSHQLRQPAMQQRLQALSADEDITGDATAGLLLWLVVSGLKQLELDQVSALIRRALQAPDLSPRGCCQLLQATARTCDRWPQQASEVVNMLQRSPPDLVALMADKAARLAAAGQLHQAQLTDVAQSLAKLRYLQTLFVEEMAAAVLRGLRDRDELPRTAAKTRDVTVALHTCALFAHRHPAVSELFAAAADDLERRLQGLTLVTLVRIAWSYAVAGCCGLLPKGAPGERVQSFLQALCEVFQSRVSEVASSHEFLVSGQLRFALQIWSATQPRLAPRGLLEAVHLRQHLRRKHHREPQPQAQPGAQGAARNRSSSSATASASESSPASSGTTEDAASQVGAGAGSTQPGTYESGGSSGSSSGSGSSSSSRSGGGGTGQQKPLISELQRDVYRQLRQLGYDARLEERVGFWTVDIWFKVGSRGVAVEVDGPWHFTTSARRTLLGPSLARNACLRALGLVVLPVCFTDYDRWHVAQRGEKLRLLVEEAVRAPRERSGV